MEWLILFGVAISMLVVQEVRLQRWERLPIQTAHARLVELKADNHGLSLLHRRRGNAAPAG